MADEKIAVRIFFKTDGGPVSVGQYQFDPETLKKLRDDFSRHITKKDVSGAAYDCEVMRHGSSSYVPTVLILKFGEVLYIG
jgi:hypothetical protein